MLASVILSRARLTLLDPSSITWTDAELLDYLNAAITTIIAHKPDANTVTTTVALVAGPLQALPTGGVQLLNVTRNIASGRFIREINRDALDTADPSWAAAANQALDVLNYIPDARNPTKYNVYPPSNGASSVEIVYVATPTRLTASSDTFPILDVYETAAWLFVVASAFAKNTKRGDLTKFQSYMQQFAQLLGIKTQVQFAIAPKLPLAESQ